MNNQFLRRQLRHLPKSGHVSTKRTHRHIDKRALVRYTTQMCRSPCPPHESALSIARSRKGSFLFTKHQTADGKMEAQKEKEISQQGVVKVGGSTEGLALISENNCERLLWVMVKWQRTMWRVGSLGREMVASRERMKAKESRTTPGTE